MLLSPGNGLTLWVLVGTLAAWRVLMRTDVRSCVAFITLTQVLYACTKMQPQPCRDDALLQALCNAATRRWDSQGSILQAENSPPSHLQLQRNHCFRTSVLRLLETDACSVTRTTLCRLLDGAERPSPQAVGMIVSALGRLGFRPPCVWDAQSGGFAHVLDGLCAELADALPQASPQVRV